MTDLALLRLLEPTDRLRAAVARLGGEVRRVGPFEAYLHPDPEARGFQYAQPIEPLPGDDEVVAGLSDLRRLFAQRDVPVSIELNAPLFPRLPAILESQGFVITDREPLMILDPADFTPITAADVTVRFLGPEDSDAALSAFARIFTEVLMERAYTESPKEIARLRSEAEHGGGRSHALATIAGQPAGTGFITTSDEIAEITRVATLPAYRRRGVAATLTSFMLASCFEQGGRMAWLTAAARPAQILYERLGFRLVGERLYYSDPKPGA